MKRLVFATGLLLAGAGGTASEALAHARLVRSTPADRAVLSAPPRAVRVLFDDAVVPAPGIAAVRNGDGSVLGGKAQMVPGRRRELVIPLRPGLGRGDYSVRWRVVSDDGHLIAGVLAFAVGSGRSPPTSALSAGTTEPAALDVLSRWLFLGGVLLAVGTAVFALAIWRPLLRELNDFGRGRVHGLLLAGCLIAVAGGLLVLRDASTSTRFGVVILTGVAAAGGVAVLAALALVRPPVAVLAAAAALPLAVVPTLAGHALDPGRSPLEAVADALHVTAAAVWLGGLAAFFAVVPGQKEHGPVGAAVRRFSRLALGAVAALALTGLVRALSELTSFHQLWTIGYGRTILVKTGLFAGLVALAWVNRYRLVPRLPATGAARRLRENVGTELALLACLVGAAALLTELRPGRAALATAQPTPPRTVDLRPPPPPPRGALVLARQAGALAVALAVSPGAPQRLTATILGPSGEALSGRSVSFRVTNRRVVPARPCGRGCYAATAPSGLRLQTVEVRLGEGERAVFHLPAEAPHARGIVRRAGLAIRHLRTLVYLESLSSGGGTRVVTTWRFAAPYRLTYQIRGGAAAIVIGRRRWDKARPAAGWSLSSQIPPLRVPQPAWGAQAVDAHVVGKGRVDGRRVWIVSFANPTIPAWFTAWIDRRNYRTLRLRMTAAAHFMVQRRFVYNRPVPIRPPRER